MSSVWYRLDNSAKIFPAVANSINSAVFRMSVVLKEPVDPIRLQEASDKLYDIYPMYMVGLKMGLFWYYLNPLKEPLKVKEEHNYPCYPLNFKQDNSMIRILYYNNRISLEVFHALTDGNGALEFLKSLLYFYIYNEDQKPYVDFIRTEFHNDSTDYEDSYLNYSQKSKGRALKLPKALNIEGTAFNYPGNLIVTGQFKTQDILTCARSYEVTITVLLTAVLIQAILLETSPTNTKPIVISIPVNLRKYFESKTLRNFFAVANITCSLNRNATFEEILDVCKKEAQQEINFDKLQSLINQNVAIQNYPLIKFVPAKIKNQIINLGVLTVGERTKTMTLTNLGRLEIPEDMHQHIHSFEASLYPSKKSPINAAMISSKDTISFSFISRIKERDIIKRYFRIIEHDLKCDVSVYSNNWQEGDLHE